MDGSSTLEEIKRHIIPISCSFARETTRADKNQKERLGQQSESGVLRRMYLNPPIEQNLTHQPGKLLLQCHVFRIEESGELRVRY